MITKLTLNGHTEKIAADLATARDNVLAGKAPTWTSRARTATARSSSSLTPQSSA